MSAVVEEAAGTGEDAVLTFARIRAVALIAAEDAGSTTGKGAQAVPATEPVGAVAALAPPAMLEVFRVAPPILGGLTATGEARAASDGDRLLVTPPLGPEAVAAALAQGAALPAVPRLTEPWFC